MTTMASSAAIGLAPRVLSAQEADALHREIAQRVQDLAAGSDITLRLLLPNGSGGNVDPVIAAFTQMTGVSIETTQTLVDEINTELTLDALGNTRQYDVALPATFGLPDLVQANAIRPISDFAAQYEPPQFRDDILFGTGDTFDADIYGFQTDGDAYVMFYNKDMLENPDEQAAYAAQFGTALAVPETWQELDRQIAFFNRPAEGQWGGLLFRTPGYLAWEWWVRFHAKGLWPFSDEMEPQIASAQGVAALQEMIETTQHLSPEVASLGLFENWERFSRGDIYCNIGWGGSQKYFMSEAGGLRGKLAYGQTPGGQIDGTLLKTPYFNWGWNYVVTRNSRHPEVSYLFALFASTPVMSTLSVQQVDGFFDPFRPEHYTDQKIIDAYTADFLTVHKESMRSAIPDLYLSNQGEYFRVLGQWLTRALAEDVSAEEALDRTSQQWRLITNGTDRGEQSARWANLKQKYPADLQLRLQDL